MILTLPILLFAAQVTAQEPIVVEKSKMVCRETEQETGTHIRTGRRCKTDEDWQREDAQKRSNPATMRITQGQGDALTKQPPQ